MLENYNVWIKILEPLVHAVPDAATATTEVGKSRKKRNSIPSSSSTAPARKRGKGRRGASPLQLDPIEGNNDKRVSLTFLKTSAIMVCENRMKVVKRFSLK